jgi:methionine-rich copper-binding protein CopC
MLQTAIRRAATLLLASLALVMVPGLVLAHAELQTATPADKSTVTAPVAEVSGIYSEAMKPAGSSIIVKDASGATVAQGTVDPADTTRMVAKPSTPLGNGSYAVDWTSVALDEHVERGTWTFTVAVAPTPSPTAIATSAPSAAATAAPTLVPATPIPSIAPTPAPSGGSSTAGSGSDVVLPIVLGLIILGAGAAYLLSRRNRPPSST